MSGTGQVKFREYYDLVGDPHRLSNKLYQATPADEQDLGIPALAARLTADRSAQRHPSLPRRTPTEPSCAPAAPPDPVTPPMSRSPSHRGRPSPPPRMPPAG
ncbi:hypothetical protein [Streptomyces sp. NPDC049949]|uniref:hypothetical protein n=1 Tax=Streptomyces sp. NPDC049949 TaxID=3154627 RepID=UPI003436C327